jgi:hypothetical protein
MPPISLALIASPRIGVLVGQSVMPLFHTVGGIGKVIVSFVSLYGAAALFALAIPSGVSGGLNSGEHFYESDFALWMGLAVTGLVIILWPLAVLNFYGLAWLDRKLARQTRSGPES